MKYPIRFKHPSSVYQARVKRFDFKSKLMNEFINDVQPSTEYLLKAALYRIKPEFLHVNGYDKHTAGNFYSHKSIINSPLHSLIPSIRLQIPLKFDFRLLISRPIEFGAIKDLASSV
mmetsp:Transcript_24249/g.21352  ORF Transcript_24249/g.21352 Transcript_24249/m.21352 type:complete len:117 (-) Transcript_24249:1126-1476(-)